MANDNEDDGVEAGQRQAHQAREADETVQGERNRAWTYSLKEGAEEGVVRARIIHFKHI